MRCPKVVEKFWKNGSYCFNNRQGSTISIYQFVYFALTMGFALHLTFVVKEFLSEKYVDVAVQKSLEDFAPDVAICAGRPYVAHKMNGIINGLVLTNFESKTDVFKINLDSYKGPPASVLAFYNVLSEEAKTLMNISDIIVRCNSRGHRCDSNDFEVFPRYERALKLCIVFKAKTFFKKLSSKEKIPLHHASDDGYLDVLLKSQWVNDGHLRGNRNILKSLSSLNKAVYIVKPEEALMIKDVQHSEESILIKNGKITPHTESQIVFSLEIREHHYSGKQTAHSYELIDEDKKRIHSFSYSRELCRKLKRQKRTIETCGCYDILLPLEKNMMRNFSQCQQLPSIFQKATSVTVDKSKRILIVDNETTKSIATVSFDDPMFVKTMCFSEFSTNSFLDIQTCPHTRYHVQLDNWENDVQILNLKSISTAFQNDSITITSPADLMNYFMVRVRAASWNVLMVNKEPIYPMSKLLSDVGGMLGLWLGASIIGLIHLIVNLKQRLSTRHFDVNDIHKS